MEIVKIVKPSQDMVTKLLQLWEGSVRATHSFLTEQDIEGFVPLVEQALQKIEGLYIAVEGDKPQGFIGMAGNKIEMLFVSVDKFGYGYGTALLTYVIENLGATEVDVNEQNPQALKFYQKHGFFQYARSAFDGQAKPFPLLHLRLTSK